MQTNGQRFGFCQLATNPRRSAAAPSNILFIHPKHRNDNRQTEHGQNLLKETQKTPNIIKQTASTRDGKKKNGRKSDERNGNWNKPDNNTTGKKQKDNTFCFSSAIFNICQKKTGLFTLPAKSHVSGPAPAENLTEPSLYRLANGKTTRYRTCTG